MFFHVKWSEQSPSITAFFGLICISLVEKVELKVFVRAVRLNIWQMEKQGTIKCSALVVLKPSFQQWTYICYSMTTLQSEYQL